MKSLDEQLSIYQQHHTNKTNRLTHYVGIPFIVFSLMMLFNWVSIDIAAKWQISFSWILICATLIYYFLLNIRLAMAATVIFIVMTVIATLVAGSTPTVSSAVIFIVLFVGGWILQFVGHLFEKQKPAFLFSKTQLLIGPLFVLVEALSAMGVAKYFI